MGNQLGSEYFNRADLERIVHWDQMTSSLERLASQGSVRVLDAGCATGRGGREHFADNPLVEKVTGLDNNPKAIAAARAATTSDKFQYLVEDIVLHLPESPYDMVYASHLPIINRWPMVYVACLWDMIRPGGELVIQASDGWVQLWRRPDKLDIIDQILGGPADNIASDHFYRVIRSQTTCSDVDIAVTSVADISNDWRFPQTARPVGPIAPDGL